MTKYTNIKSAFYICTVGLFWLNPQILLAESLRVVREKATNNSIVQINAKSITTEGWIAFSGSDDGQVIIPIIVNGVEIKALFDTGTPNSSVDSTWADSHEMPYKDLGKALDSAGGAYKIRKYDINELVIGRYKQAGGAFIGSDFATLFNGGGHKFEAIIGMDFIRHFSTEIDFDRSMIKFMPSGTRPPSGARVDVKVTDGAPFLVISLSRHGHTISPFYIDSGDNSYISAYSDKSQWLEDVKNKTDIMQSSLSGNSISEYALIDDISIGGFKFPGKIPVTFLNKNPFGFYGGIGLGALSAFNVFFDPQNGIGVFRPRSKFNYSYHTSNTGIQWSNSGNFWLSVHVMKNSPAQQAGLRDGDHICKFNTVTPENGRDIPQGAEGGDVIIELCSGKLISFKRYKFY